MSDTSLKRQLKVLTVPVFIESVLRRAATSS